MNCELCGRRNAEHVGMQCGAHRACFICVNKLVSEAIEKKGEKE